MKVYWKDTAREKAWVGSYKNPVTNKWKTKSIPVDVAIANTDADKVKAQLWLADWYSKNINSNSNEAVKVKKTIRLLSDNFLIHTKKNLSETMHGQYERHLRHVILINSVADLDMETGFDTQVCREFLRSLTGAPMTKRNVMQSITAFFHICMAEGWVKLVANPFRDDVVREIIKAPKTLADNEVIYLTKDQTETLLNNNRLPILRQIRYRLVILTGLRDSELNGLQWADFKPKDSVPSIRVERQLTKPGPLGVAKFAPPKKDSKRTIPLHALALDALTHWKKEWVNWVGREPLDTDPIFPNAKGEFFAPNGARFFRDDLGTCGLPLMFEGKWPFTFHATRRTAMTLWTDAGVPEVERRRLMGHKGKDVGERNYLGNILPKLATEVAKVTLAVTPYVVTPEASPTPDP